jgi:hypothetical protein
LAIFPALHQMGGQGTRKASEHRTQKKILKKSRKFQWQIEDFPDRVAEDGTDEKMLRHWVKITSRITGASLRASELISLLSVTILYL